MTRARSPVTRCSVAVVNQVRSRLRPEQLAKTVQCFSLAMLEDATFRFLARLDGSLDGPQTSCTPAPDGLTKAGDLP